MTSAPGPPVNKWVVAISVTFGTLMGTIDASIVNVAIPHLQAGVGATVEEITWVATGFAIATVLVMPLTAFLGRLFGQKRVYLIALSLFVMGSVLCGLARSLEALVAFRVLQGLGAGALQPTEQAILRQTFPPQEQGMAMAIFGMAVLIGPALGPTLGGYIVDHASWPWIFYVNVPVGALGLLMVSRFVREPPDITAANRAAAARERRSLDWAGIGLVAVGLASMQFMLEEGNRHDWFDSPLIVGCLLVSVFALSAFVIRELTAQTPAVNLSLFRDRVFASGTLIGGVMFAILFAVTFLLPLYMQTLLGFSAFQSGVELMPRSLVMLVVTPVIGRIYNRVSPRLLVGIGIGLFAVGALQMSRFTLQTGTWQIFTSLVIQGVAFSCLFVPLTTVALSTVPRHKLADATGLNSLFRQMGGAVGLAVFATLLSRNAVTARVGVMSDVSLTRPEVAAWLSAAQAALAARGSDPVTAKQGAIAILDGLSRQQSLLLSFEKLFLLAGILFLCTLPLLLLLKSTRHAERRPNIPEPAEAE
jgi:MFS transporter, DHA2 family, multidrug resistance protein